MKEIPLTQGKVALVDDEDFEYLNQFKWSAKKNVQKKGCCFYAMRGIWDGLRVKHTLMHRIIIGAYPDGLITDHINGDGLDNRRINLRVVTRRQNNQNKHTPRTSEYPGVSWDKARKKWETHIRINGSSKFLGRFEDESAAFEAYKTHLTKIGGVLV